MTSDRTPLTVAECLANEKANFERSRSSRSHTLEKMLGVELTKILEALSKIRTEERDAEE